MNELTLGTTQVDRVRLLVCGSASVGKTSLVTSLRTRFLRAFRPAKCGGNYLIRSSTAAMNRCTMGFCVEQASIPNAGNFSVWDFSGHSNYYPVHEYFLGSRNSIYIIVCSRLHPYRKQLAQARFWLSMIKSKHRPHRLIHYGGHYGQKPFVVLVQSFADVHLPLSNDIEEEEQNKFVAASPPISEGHTHDHSLSTSTPNELIRVLVEEFGHHFMFNDKVFCLDCRQSRGSEIHSLRTVLNTLRESVLEVCM